MRTLREARQLIGMNQKQLAAYVNISIVQMSNIMRANSFPKGKTRKKFESKLGAIDWQATFEQGKLNSTNNLTKQIYEKAI